MYQALEYMYLPHTLHSKTHATNYRIMQIVRSEKISRLHDFLVIRGKTFAIVQQFEHLIANKKKSSLENLRDWRLIRESFPP